MAALDAFGRLRTAGCFTTFNYYPSPMSTGSATNLDVDIWVTRYDGTTGPSYDTQNFINMPINSGGGPSTYQLRTTKQPMIYQPGKSRLFYMTGVLMTTISTNTTSLMGLFDVDSSNPPVVTQGTYFKCDGNNFYWVDVTQDVVPINQIVQDSWNIDTFNGNGPSGKTLTVAANANKDFLIVMDQEWLGVGRIRCGFIIDGVIYYAHQFLHNGLSVQYTKTPRISLSYLIYGTTANAMRQMCSTSIIEDGYFSTGRINNVNNAINALVNVNTTNDRVLLGLRINSSFPNATFYIKTLYFYYTGGGGKFAQYKVHLFSTNGSIGTLSAATPTFTPLSNSATEYWLGDGSIYTSTPGFIIDSGYLDTQNSASIASVVNDSLQTRNLFSSYDTLYITGIASATGTMAASVTFIEDI
jgi:hypothetical protein